MTADPEREARERVLRMLQLTGGTDFDSEVAAVRQSRAGAPTPYSPSPSLASDPASPEGLLSIETLMKDGSSADRRALLNRYTDPAPGYPARPGNEADAISTQYGLSSSFIESRILSLQREVPEVPKNSSWLAKMWGSSDDEFGFYDIAGRPIGLALQALQLPAEGVERMIGLAYWNEIPLGDRWHMAAVTYDSIWSDLFSGGKSGSRAAVAAYRAGTSLDTIEEEFANVWVDTGVKMLLDPLNLIGGLPLVGKLGARSLGPVGRLAADGIPLGAVRKIPGLSKLGLSPELELEQSYAQLLNDTRAASEFNSHRVTGGLRRAFHLSPQARADEDIGHMLTLTAQFRDPALWDDNATAMNQMFQAFANGQPSNPQALGRGFESSTWVRKLRSLMQGNQDLAQTWQRFESLKPVDPSLRHWADAPEALRTSRNGQQVGIHELVKQGVPLSPEEGTRYAAYRVRKFEAEFMEKGAGAIRGHYALQSPDFLERLDRVSAGMKSWLAMVTLNNPRFVAMNYMSNAAALAAKGGDMRGAARFALFNRTGRRVKSLLGEAGFEDLNQIASDTAYHQEFLGHVPTKFLERHKTVNAALTWGIEAASKVDHGTRTVAVETGMTRAAHATWRIGDGGVIPPLPPSLVQNVPGIESWVSGLTLSNFDEIDEFWNRLVTQFPAAALNNSPVGAVGPTGGSLLQQWATRMWTAQFPNVAPSATNNPSLIANGVPQAIVDEIDDALEAAAVARGSGAGEDWASVLSEHLDTLADHVDLEVFRALRRDGFETPPLPLDEIRDTLAPWQTVAHFEQASDLRQQAVQRLIAANRVRFGDTAPQVQATVDAARAEYNNAVLSAYEALMQVNRLDPGAERSWDAARRSIVSAFIEMETRVTAAVADQSEVSTYVKLALERESQALVRDLGRRGAAFKRPEWADDIRQIVTEDQADITELYRTLQLDMRQEFAKLEYPTQAGRVAVEGQQTQDYVRFIRSQMASFHTGPNAIVGRAPLVRTAPTPNAGARGIAAPAAIPAGAPPWAQQLHDYLYGADGLKTAMRQRNSLMAHSGRAHRDLVALNYSRRYGIDSVLNLAFPYQFWLTRTVRDWARLSMYRPGATAAYSRLYDMVAEINEDASLPDRLKRQVKIPIPFLDDALPELGGLGGSSGVMMFDPIKALYPLATLQDRETGDRTGMTAAGQVYDFAGNVGPGINPFMTLGLGGLGVLGDRADWVRRGFSSVSNLPGGLPGPRGLRAAYDWLTGISEDPDPAVLTSDVKDRLARGESLPEPWLKAQLSNFWDLVSTDGFDGYRVDRTIANMVAEDPQRWTPRAAMEAIKTHKGELYTEAKRRARTDYGLRVLSGWAVMPLNVYPEGERVQRGLDAMYREVQLLDDPKATEDFFARHPEYRVRQVLQKDRDDPAGQLREVDTTLFYLDLGAVESKYQPRLDEIEQAVMEGERRGYLQTKEGRRQLELLQAERRALTDQREDETDAIRGLYPHRRTTLTYKASPTERALYAMREEYFAIRRDQYKTADEFRAARAAFIANLPQQGEQWYDRLARDVEALARWFETDDRIAASGARGDEIERQLRERDAALDALTTTARGNVSREAFLSYLDQGKRAPTAERVEYQTASAQIRAYFAIDAADGLSPSAKKTLMREYWQSHPLLGKYYGNDEPRAWNAESAAAYGEMDTIWDGYYEREDDIQAQRDWLASKLGTLNTLRERVGLKPIQLQNWRLP